MTVTNGSSKTNGSANGASSYPPLKDSTLFTPLELGKVKLEHRLVLAPLTRLRGRKVSDGVYAPSDLHVQYYGQRASKGGLLLTEATEIYHRSCGYPGGPGVYDPAQLAAWKKVTDAVHAKGGYIFCQLWHTGRASPATFLAGQPPVSSSDIPIKGKAADGSDFEATPPRPLTVDEIHNVTKKYALAAKLAVEEAGFDGVEIHGANGYLLDQFLHDNVNLRTDEYGGSIENRCRFPLEVISAVCEAVGPERVGIRLSPYNYFQDTRDSDPNSHWAYLCQRIIQLPQRLTYVHMVEPRFDEVLDHQAKMNALAAYKANGNGIEAEATRGKEVAYKPSLAPFSKILANGGVKFLTAGGFSRDNCTVPVEEGYGDAIVFGRWFISNPDLPKRLAEGLPLNQYDRSTFYGADPPEKGYVDYPTYEETVAA
ncbi:hypothetical protein BKA81DRAFT_298111 [Phyllosticta paracitricarpa]|uniref:NADH:flavin oxidoreductase/NADH oxidase N-terminal domain-containing protein n=1 Tax=Phyllosticta paracitricarpa TaxID=2016321 RepID=A0ABR1N7G7_9PEZI